MADALEDTEKLIVRALTAIAEARRLTAESRRELRHAGDVRLRHLLYYHSAFHPKPHKHFSLRDFPKS
jgi:hypothetical protein